MLWNLYKDDKITYEEWQILQKKLEGHDRELIKSIEAEPVRHGHWKHTFGGYVNCSVCGSTPLLDGEREYVETCYCPVCGAKMDEVEE